MLKKKWTALVMTGFLAIGNIAFADDKDKGKDNDSNGLRQAVQALQAADASLQNQISNIKLTPGPVGPQGPAGPVGPAGITGPMGPAGAKGDTGPAGVAGPKGDTGATGAMGPMGPQGLQGLTGAMGPMGPQGLQGLTGANGATGPVGPIGPVGPQGATGAKGDTGALGPQGLKGDTGPAGAKGDTGAVGPQGPQGPQGVKGDTGPAGSSGPKQYLVTCASEGWETRVNAPDSCTRKYENVSGNISGASTSVQVQVDGLGPNSNDSAIVGLNYGMVSVGTYLNFWGGAGGVYYASADCSGQGYTWNYPSLPSREKIPSKVLMLPSIDRATLTSSAPLAGVRSYIYTLGESAFYTNFYVGSYRYSLDKCATAGWVWWNSAVMSPVTPTGKAIEDILPGPYLLIKE